MNALRTRLIRLAAGLLLARLAAWGVMEATPETALALERWVDQTVELLFVAADAWLRRRVAISSSRRAGSPRAPGARTTCTTEITSCWSATRRAR